jgi:uridylate kinase
LENKLKYKRILLKLSGEFFRYKEEEIHKISLKHIINEIKTIYEMGVTLGIVVGGGNIIRGAKDSKTHGLPQEELDELGMQATVINGSILSNYLREEGIHNSVISAIPISPSLGEPYNKIRMKELLSQNNVMIFVGGTGNPYFTTDTASVLRALQMNADILLKATKVDGVYDKDPLTNKDAYLYDRISFKEAIDKGLEIMDLTAFSMAWHNNLPIIVFNATISGNIKKSVKGEKIGTILEGGTNG